MGTHHFPVLAGVCWALSKQKKRLFGSSAQGIVRLRLI